MDCKPDCRAARIFLAAAVLAAGMAIPRLSAQSVDGLDVFRRFVPSGMMGDGEHNGLRLEAMNEEQPHSPPFSHRWEYLPVINGVGWAAVAYQFPANNWGDRDGQNLSGKGYREISCWARGVPDTKGRLPVVQFKAGGGTDPARKYQASFEAQSEFLTLTGEWKRYSISLQGKDLSRVIAALTIILRAEDNPQGAVFFLDDCIYQ